MGFIRILRWRIGGALGRLSRRPKIYELESTQRAAIFLVAVGEEHAALLLDQLADHEVHDLSFEIHRFSQVDEATSLDVLAEFLQGLSVEHLPNYVSREEPDEIARAFVRSNPALVAERVRALWLSESEELGQDDEDDESLVELEYGDLEREQKAAVFLMWLPPELSAMVLAELRSSLVPIVTHISADLPFVTPCAREKVLCEFMDGVTLGITGLSIEDVGIPVVVEAFVRSNPALVARRLEERWLSLIAVDVAGAESQAPAQRVLDGVQRAAVFFQSLSLPLAHRLLGSLTEEETTLILEAIDQVGAMDSETRKEVLKELMQASSFGNDDQPIHVLGKAMGQMIRRRPEVVANQVRKLWLK